MFLNLFESKQVKIKKLLQEVIVDQNKVDQLLKGLTRNEIYSLLHELVEERAEDAEIFWPIGKEVVALAERHDCADFIEELLGSKYRQDFAEAAWCYFIRNGRQDELLERAITWTSEPKSTYLYCLEATLRGLSSPIALKILSNTVAGVKTRILRHAVFIKSVSLSFRDLAVLVELEGLGFDSDIVAIFFSHLHSEDGDGQLTFLSNDFFALPSWVRYQWYSRLIATLVQAPSDEDAKHVVQALDIVKKLIIEEQDELLCSYLSAEKKMLEDSLECFLRLKEQQEIVDSHAERFRP